MLLALVLNVLFLLRYGAFHSFVFLLRTVLPVYNAFSAPGQHALLADALPHTFLPLLPLLGLAYLCRRRWNWERSVILLGALCGLLSYLIQRKGFWYQRYTFLAFGLLLASIEILPRFRERRCTWAPVLSAFALLYATLHILPRDLRVLRTKPGASALTAAMETDLVGLGGERLQREVQCFDITFGCLNSLYHLQLVENTGFTGDLLLFPERPNPATAYYRDLFWKAQGVHPASVIVLTSQDFGHPNSYDRLARWPEFARYLEQNYSVAVSRAFPYEDKLRGEAPAPLASAFAYRIYLRKGQVLANTNAGSAEGR